MTHTIAEIARRTGLRAEGSLERRVSRAAEPAAAGPDDLALAMSPAYAEALGAGRARAAVLWEGADWRALGLDAALFAPRARVALAEIGAVFAPAPDIAPGIHPSAVIDPTAIVEEDVWIGPFAVIGPNARIGRGGRIGAHASVGRAATLGPDAVLHAGVRIGREVEIGPGFVAQPNAVIGADGFSYVTPERGSVESAKETGAVAEESRNTALRRINALGTVRIGADVEIGAGAAIDRATVGATEIGDGTKIDNLVQIGHNCRIGRTCLICGHVGLAGSVEVGDRAVLGGKVGVGDHLRIGADAVLAGGSLVGTNIPPGSVMMGAPAQPRDRAYAELKALRRLPRLIEELREMRAKLGL
jgi:UDP-3-O-[3-hydroxymyristoyl] glucosamine N-acyltransferase